MVNLSKAQWEELKRYRIQYGGSCENGGWSSDKNNDDLHPLTAWLQDDLGSLTSRVMKWTQAPNMRVVCSIWLRQYAFLIIGHLYMLSKYRLFWKGSIHEVKWLEPGQSSKFVTFILQRDDWEPVSEEKVTSTIRHLLTHWCAPMTHHLSNTQKMNKDIFWENIWGYTAWMYTQLLKEGKQGDGDQDETTDVRGGNRGNGHGDVCGDEHRKAQVEQDVQVLLLDLTWEGIEQGSPFRRYVGDQSISDNVAQYKRKTCCLYYKLPGQTICPYCPLQGCQ